MADIKGHANSMLEAFNSDDWDGMRSLMGQSTYHEHGTQRTLQGDETIEAMQGWKGAMPDVTGTITNAIEGGDQIALEVTWEGNHTGPLVTPDGEIPPSGKHQATPSIWLLKYEGDALKESHLYFDMLTLLQQIGAA